MLPSKQVETQHGMLCTDLIGKLQLTHYKRGRQYVMKGKKDKDVYLQAITTIDPATGWIEIYSVPEARADLATNKVVLAWLIMNPLPNKNTVFRGKEVLKELKTMMANDYVKLYRLISTRNSHGNTIGLQCTLLHSIHRQNWYLVGIQS